MRSRLLHGGAVVSGLLALTLGGRGSAGAEEASRRISVNPETPIYMPGTSRVHDTVLRELARVLGEIRTDSLRVIRADAPVSSSLFVGQLGESKGVQALARQGAINLHNVPPDKDAYEILVHDGTLFLVGNTPRGMLHAVFKLQELLLSSTPIDAQTHLQGTFQFRERYFHQRFDEWPGEPADIRYISHLGASHCLLTHDWQGNRRHLQGYVISPMFPDAVDEAEVKTGHRDLRMLINACLDYALEPCLWMTELPCQGGPWVPESTRQRFLRRFPEEMLSDSGTYQGKVLCFGHNRVRDFYRDLLVRFFADFPEVSTFFLFGLDADGEFCDPQTCTRCRGLGKIDQRDRLIRFLIEEGQKVRPGLRVLTTGWGWSGNTEAFLSHQRELPSSSGLYLAAETDGWQPERQLHDLLRAARGLCRQRGQTFVGYDDLHWGDDTVHQLNDIQDYPLSIGAKLRRWHELQVDGVFDHWGGFNRDISCNSVACREFFLNPLADPAAVCRNIAARQFGDKAGPLVLKAWQALDRAHAALSYACIFPPAQWPGWYQGRNYTPTPEAFSKQGVQGGEPPRRAGAITYNSPDLSSRLQSVGDAWRLACPHYVEASERLREAAEWADDTPVFYAFWWSGKGKTPSRREHLRRERIYVDSMHVVGREIGIHFSLNALYERVRHDAAAYRQQAKDLLLEDVRACRDAADYLERLKAQGDDRQLDRDWVRLYRGKADGIEAWLK